jgi:hypothetical protein
MAIQLIPIIKAAAPYIAQIATVAIPAFTARKEAASADGNSDNSADTAAKDAMVAKQIEELQAAASQNAQSIQLLAENLQKAIENIDVAASEAEKKIALYQRLIMFSFGLSAVSLALCVYLLVTQA